METTDNGRITPRTPFLTVLIQVAVMGLVAGVTRLAHEITSPSYELRQTVATRNATNPTEQSMLGYYTVKKRLCAGDDQAALRLLKSLENAPVSVDGNTFSNRELATFSPQGLLMALGNALCDKANRAAEQGDYAVAEQYAAALAHIGDRVLSDSSPTLACVETAHYLHRFAAQVQAKASASGIAGMIAGYRSEALQSLWRRDFAPRLAAHQPTKDVRNEQRFAADLAREYRAAWSRIRAGEV